MNSASDPSAQSTARCTMCRLGLDPRTRVACVSPSGSASPLILVVGEAPDTDEERHGAAFVGAAAEHAKMLLADAGVPLEAMRWTHTTRCLPRNDKSLAREPDFAEETAVCASYLWKEIEQLQPKVIVALGSFATRVLTGEAVGSISEMIGTVRTISLGGRQYPLIISLHFQADLRSSFRHSRAISQAFAKAYALSQSADRSGGGVLSDITPIESATSAISPDAVSAPTASCAVRVESEQRDPHQETQPSAGTTRDNAPESSPLEGRLSEVTGTVNEHFPGLGSWAAAILTVFAVRCFQNIEQPTALIGVGVPSAGKSTPLTWVLPVDERDPLTDHVYRSDGFTAASFVSHRVDRSPRALEDSDLLPKIKDKVLVTRELSPVFRGKRNELAQRFSMLTSVMDGMGYVSDSGAHGRRGYEERINFCWLGATTPLSAESFEALQGPGAKLFFFDLDRPRKTIEELVESSVTIAPQAGSECARLVRGFLTLLYEVHPLHSIEGSEIVIGAHQRRRLAACADLLARLRATISGHDVVRPEHAERAMSVLTTLARASAVAHGRRSLADTDLDLVLHVAISSGFDGRKQVLRAVLTRGGQASTSDVTVGAQCSEPTARKYMAELELVGLGTVANGSPQRITLSTDCLAVLQVDEKGGSRQ